MLLYSNSNCLSVINFDLENTVDETAVDKIGVDEMAVDKIGVDEPGRYPFCHLHGHMGSWLHRVCGTHY